MSREEQLKAYLIIKDALNVVCTEENIDCCDACPFYDPMCAENPCLIDHYAKPFMASIFDRIMKRGI